MARLRPLPLLLALLALVLLGTLVVLTTVQHYYAIDVRDLLTPQEIATWETWAAELELEEAAREAPAWGDERAEERPAERPELSWGEERAQSEDDGAKGDGAQIPLTLRPSGASGLAPTPTTATPSVSATLVRPGSPDGSASSTPSIYLPESEAPHSLPSIYLPPSYTPSIYLPTPTPRRPAKERLVPRLIHQTWKDANVPERWEEVRRGCQEMHPDYNYHLWTDATARTFLATHYPWFLETFDGYQYSIQRADVIRYFILHHYGGFYLDLDVGCRRRLEPLRYAPLLLPQTIPIGISNDIMASIPRHPFWEMTVRNLEGWDVNLVLKYATVMFTTGPMFMSFQYNLWPYTHGVPISIDPATSAYLNLSFPAPESGEPFWDDEERKEVRVLPRLWYGKNNYVVDNETDPVTGSVISVNPAFFKHYFGSSWHSNDAGFVTMLGRSGMLLPYLGLGILIVGLLSLGFSRSRSKTRPRSSRSRPPRRGSRELPSYRSGHVPEQVLSSLWNRGDIRLSEDAGQSGGVLVWLYPSGLMQAATGRPCGPAQQEAAAAAPPTGWRGWLPRWRGADGERAGKQPGGDARGYAPLPTYSRPASPDGTGTEATSDTEELDGEASEAESEWESPSGHEGEDSTSGGFLSRLRFGGGMKLKKIGRGRAGGTKRRARSNTLRAEDGDISPIGRSAPTAAATSGEEDDDEGAEAGDVLPPTVAPAYAFFARRSGKDGRAIGHRARVSSGGTRYPDPPSRPQSVSGTAWFQKPPVVAPPLPPVPGSGGKESEWAEDAQAVWGGEPPQYEPSAAGSSSAATAANASEPPVGDAKPPPSPRGSSPPPSPNLLTFSPSARQVTFASSSNGDVRAQVDQFLKEMEPRVGGEPGGPDGR